MTTDWRARFGEKFETPGYDCWTKMPDSSFALFEPNDKLFTAELNSRTEKMSHLARIVFDVDWHRPPAENEFGQVGTDHLLRTLRDVPRLGPEDGMEQAVVELMFWGRRIGKFVFDNVVRLVERLPSGPSQFLEVCALVHPEWPRGLVLRDMPVEPSSRIHGKNWEPTLQKPRWVAVLVEARDCDGPVVDMHHGFMGEW